MWRPNERLWAESRLPVWTWIVAALLLGIVYAVVIPPFGAPDEAQHFHRAWYVSSGHFTAALHDGVPGVFVPPEVSSLFEPFLYNISKGKFSRDGVRPALAAPPVRAEAQFLPMPTHSYSSGLGYLPQAFGIGIGRLFRQSPLVCFYLGRFANLIAGVLLIAVAIHFFPAYRWLALLLALTPMATHVRSSLSLDVTALGLSFLFIALVARALFLDDRPIGAGLWSAITILGVLLCMTKINYVPIVALALAAPTKRFATTRFAWIARGALVLGGAIGAAIATAIASYFYAPYRTGVQVDPQLQMKFIFDHPLEFLGILKLEYVNHAKWYLISMVGDLGSGNHIVVLPKLLVAFYFAALLTLLMIDTNARLNIAWWQRIWFGILCAAATLAVALAIYTTWNPVGWERIDGLQGRYYMPFVPAAALIFHRSAAGARQTWRLAIAIAVTVVSHPLALYSMITRWF